MHWIKLVSEMAKSRREGKIVSTLPQVVVLWTRGLWRQEVM